MYWVDTTIIPFAGEDGRPYKYMAIRNDITARKKAEENIVQLNSELESKVAERTTQLTQTQNEFNQFLERVNEVMFSFDIANPGFIKVSGTCERVFGYSQAEFHADPGLWRKLVYPDDIEGLITGNAAKLQQGGGWSSVFRIIHKKTGELRWVEASMVPTLNAKGEVLRYDGLCRDVTDRETACRKIAETNLALQASEDKFKKIFNASLEGMAIITPEGSIIDANTAFCKNLGYTRDELLQLNRDAILVNEDDDEHVAIKSRKGKGWYFGLVKFRQKGGSVIDAEISSVLVEDSEGQKLVFICSRDVTQKIKAGQQLENSERRFKALIEQGQDVITLMDAQYNIIYRSPSYATVLGYTIPEMDQRVPFENVYPDDIPLLKGMVAEMMSNPGASVNAVWRQRHKNGQWLWLEGRGTNLLHDPLVNAIVNNFRDITEGKRTKDQLTQANHELNQLFNSIDEVLYSAERNPFRLIHMSASCQKIYGYTAEEFFKKGELWQEVILPEDMTVVAKIFKALDAGKIANGEYRIKHKNGSIRWIDATVTPTLNAEGILVRVDGINRDITGKKEADEKRSLSEQRFKALIEKGKDAVAIINKDRDILYLSPSVQNITGYRAEELLGVSSASLLHPDEAADSAERIQKMRTNLMAGNSVKYEGRVRHKNGSWVWLDVTLTNQLDDPAVGGIVVNFHDITGHKKALEEIDALNHSLEAKVEERTLELLEANKLLESYNYSVAHDLKSPLRILAGYAKVLSDSAKERLTDRDRELLDTITSSSKKMSQLVADLLHFSQVKQDRINPEETDMDVLLDEVIASVKETDVAPFAQIKRQLLGTAFCDSRLMKQVWINIISNAVKYSKLNAQPAVEIGMEMTDGRKVYFVRDNGVGFDNVHANKLFEVFYRLHRDNAFEGTGVGLALVKSVITHHGGEIWAEGKVGSGATFRFYLDEPKGKE